MARSQTTRPTTGESLPRARDIEQADLFGAARPSRLRAAARSTDPATSHAAARTAHREISLKQLSVLDCFRSVEEADLRVTAPPNTQGMIDEGLIRLYRSRREHIERDAWWPLQTDSGLRTRRSELVTLQYLRDSGRKYATAAGSPSIVWELTDAGRALNVQAFRITLENKLARRKQYRSKKDAGDLR
jgi:hypothetical protein